METWKEIKDFPGYEVSDYGRVRSNRKRTPIILKPLNHSAGYVTVNLYKVGSHAQYQRLIHQLVLEAFAGNRPSSKHDATHNDGDKRNNNLSNLSWKLHSENIAEQITLRIEQARKKL